MTIKKDGRTFVVHCDECPESLDTDRDDHQRAVATIRYRGWRTFKGPDGEWANACPACVEHFARQQRTKP
jgi:hypothetical protein